MITLYSGLTCPHSHRCRIVLYEKGMDFEIIDVDLYNKPAELAILHPRNGVPVLLEGDLLLYEANIINEYIDERFPHPQLMPAHPAMRAKVRLVLFHLEHDVFCHLAAIENGPPKAADRARGLLRDRLMQLVALVARQKYLLGTDFSMLDVTLAPLLWRLDHYGIRLTKQASALLKYAERVFSRPAFIESLTPAERLLRK